MGRHHGRTVIITLLCTCLTGPILAAEENDRPASVIVAIVPGENADTAYQSILRDALLVNLTRSRMIGAAVETPDEARASARKGQADYLILGSWRNTADTIELSLELLPPKGTKPLATARAAGRISLTMDSVVGAALDQLLPRMRARFPADSTAATTGTATGAAGGTTGTITAVGPSDAGAGLPEQPARWRRVELGFGGAPLVTTGTVTEYAKIGAFSAIDMDFRFPAGRGVLAAGLMTGAGWFRAAGVGVADILMVPLGVEARWTITATSNPGVALHAAAGPAAIVAVTSWADTVWKISPFVVGGFDVDIAFTPVLGLRVEADYTAIFEGSMVLQGLTPRISLRTRF
jgi:hypothetical protein